MLKFNYYEYTDKEKGCKAIKAVTTYEGRTVYGVAYLHPDDSYNYELGKEIAELRCTLKVIERKNKRYSRKSTYIKQEMVNIVEYLEKLSDTLEKYDEIMSANKVEELYISSKLGDILEKIS